MQLPHRLPGPGQQLGMGFFAVVHVCVIWVALELTPLSADVTGNDMGVRPVGWHQPALVVFAAAAVTLLAAGLATLAHANRS